MTTLTVEVADRGPAVVQVDLAPAATAALAAASAAHADMLSADASADSAAQSEFFAAASADAADASADAAAADRVQTGLDRTQTGLDRGQTGLDASSAAASLASTISAALLAGASLTSLTAAIAAAGLPALPATTIALGSETQGLAIEISASVKSNEVKVLDTTTPANTKQTSLSLWTTGWGPAKACRLADGSMRWSEHNLFLQSETFSNASWVKPAPAITVAGPDGAGLWTLTATGTTLAMTQNFSQQKGLTYAQQWIVKKGTAQVFAVSFNTLTAYVDLDTGVVSNVSAGLTCATYTTAEDGVTPLAAGEWRVLAYYTATGTGASGTKINGCDASGSLAVTNGRTLLVRRAILAQGPGAVDYVKTTTIALNGPGYDWTHGRRLLLLENFSATHRALWTEDMTQAVWVKAGSPPTVALTGTSPLGGACSRVTVGANNDTILQTVTNAATTWCGQAQIKSISGSGLIDMTCDGGTTWTPVIAGTATFKTCYVKGTTANPVFGFRFRTAGDVFDISLATLSQTSFLVSPIVVGDTALTRSQDAPTASGLFPTAAAMTFYADLVGSLDGGVFSVGFTGASGRFVQAKGASGQLQCQVNDTVTTYTSVFGDAVSGTRRQVTVRSAGNAYLASVDGTGAMFDGRPNAITPTAMSLGTGGGMMWLDTLIAIPRDYGDFQLERWHYDGVGRDARYLDDVLIAPFKRTAQTYFNRAPFIVPVVESDDELRGWAASYERNITANGGSGEMPSQIIYRLFTFNKKTKRFSQPGATVVLKSPVGWSTGSGNVQDACLRFQKNGTKRGRLHFIYSQLDTGNGSISPTDWRPMYYQYSDDGGVSWSTAVKIKDAGSGYATLADPAGVIVELPADHSSGHGGRLIVAYYAGGTGGAADPTVLGTGVVYCDNPSAASPGWSHAVVAGVGTDEPTISIRPNGELLMTVRSETAGVRYAAKSTDGGTTWTSLGALSGTEYIPVSMSLVDLDPTGGLKGPLGAPCLVGVRQSPQFLTRTKFTLEVLQGDPPVPSGVQFTPFGFNYGSGYNGTYRCSDGTILAHYEISPTHNLNADASTRLAAFAPALV